MNSSTLVDQFLSTNSHLIGFFNLFGLYYKHMIVILMSAVVFPFLPWTIRRTGNALDDASILGSKHTLLSRYQFLVNAEECYNTVCTFWFGKLDK